MIVCPEAGFFFMHIPKNGGSSVRDQIQPFDHFGGAFRGTKEHPMLGLYDSAHVPLALVRDHFPDAFATLSTLEGYAILRDPADRFSSSMAQLFRQIRQRRPDTVTAQEVRAELDTVIAELTRGDRRPAPEFAFFTRQSEFVDLCGTRMVSNLYRLSDTGLLIRALGQRLNTPLVEDFHSNKTVTFRHDWMAGPVTALKDFTKAHAPSRITDALRRGAMRLLTTPKVETIDAEVRASEEVQSFIAKFYRADFELFHSVPARHPEPQG